MTDLLQRNPTYLLITKMKIKTIVMFLFVLNITFMVLRIKCFSTILVFDICQSLVKKPKFKILKSSNNYHIYFLFYGENKHPYETLP